MGRSYHDPFYCISNHIIPYHTTLYHTMPCHIPYYTMPCHTIYHTIPCHAMPYTMPYHAIPHHAIPHHTIPFHTILIIISHHIPQKINTGGIMCPQLTLHATNSILVLADYRRLTCTSLSCQNRVRMSDLGSPSNAVNQWTNCGCSTEIKNRKYGDLLTMATNPVFRSDVIGSLVLREFSWGHVNQMFT